MRIRQENVSEVRVGGHSLRDVEVQVGALDYGFAVDAIIGADVPRGLSAVIDLGSLELAAPA